MGDDGGTSTQEQDPSAPGEGAGDPDAEPPAAAEESAQ
jgi:hypothetical protein